ncbi:MAG: tetratricopeptide repeat protein [Deltaproteobacteria bacterium]|nr:tetratricopeptide repeat protein [Deltaproteobacteria bacterium]
MNRVVKTLLCLVVMVLIFAADGFALDKYYLLKKGNIARDEGKIEEAIEYYQEYIESHPTTRWAHSNQYHKRIQYYIRNLLIAYSNILDIYKENGESEPLDKWIKKLKDAYFSSSFGSKNMYSLARIYLDNGLSPDAIILFEQIIREQEKNHNPNNNKVMLRAYSKLLKIYKSQGKNEKATSLIGSLRSNYPASDFDLKDKHKLAALYLKYGMETDGEELLREIIDEGDFHSDSSNINVLIKTYSKLLKICHNKKDRDCVEQLAEQISHKFSAPGLSPNNMYTLAIAYLKCGKKEEGSRFLTEITDHYSYTTFGRKALFLLGRLSQSNKDWDSAIGYYAEYVKRYPDPPFFALKAYSRLIDSYWSRDANMELVQDETRDLCDIVNGISDFETQLNLARDLRWKGMDEMASATFSLGLSSAMTFISENKNTYKALRAYWTIEKYAYAMDRFDLVEESANRVLEIVNKLKNASLRSERSEKVEHIKSQTYLWLAKVYRERQDHPEAARFLKMFIENYPNHKDMDYARYELGMVCEDENDSEEAISMYRKIGDGMWKRKAEKRLSILGH